MPVQLQDAVVIRHAACKLIPSISLPFSPPNEFSFVSDGVFAQANLVDAVNASNMSQSRVLSLVAPAVFTAPASKAAIAAGSFAAPAIKTSISAALFSAPINIGSVAAANMAAPAVKAPIASVNFIAPRILSGAAALLFAAPRTLNSLNAVTFIAPRILSFIPAAQMAVARVLTPKAYSDNPPFPLSHSRILYQSLLSGSTVSASGGSGANVGVLQPDTFNRWQVTSVTSQSILITLPENRNIDCIAVAGLLDNSLNIDAVYSTTTGGSFVNLAAYSCVNGGARMWILASPVSIRRIQINITGAGQQTIANISAGIALQMQRPIYGGVNPFPLNRVTDYFNNRSESGNWLGRQIRRRGLESSLSFSRLTAPWYRQYFDPFVKSAREFPFYFSWRPDQYPQEVAYCWTDSDMHPSNSGGGTNHLSVSFSAEAHA